MVEKKKKAAKFLGEGSIREITARPLAFSISSRSSLHAWFHWTGQRSDSNYDSLLLRDRRKKRRTKRKKKKKKRQMRRFLKCGENSVRNLCPFKCEIQIAVKLHLYERNSNIRLVWTLSSRIFRNYYYGTDGMKLHVDGVPYILTYLSFHFKHLNRSNPHANVFLLHCIYVFDESNHILAEI